MKIVNPFHTAAPTVDVDHPVPAYPPRESLNDVGRELLADPQVRAILDTLVLDFPHIVNRLSAVWRQPTECGRLFDDLLLDDRIDRQGFPLAAVLEISDLRSYYEADVVSRLNAEAAYAPRRGATAAAPGVPPVGLIERIGSKFRRS